MNGLSAQDFFQELERIFNGDETALKDFAFLIFDTNQDGYISEMDLQELMKSSSRQKYYHKGEVADLKRDETILDLNKREDDLFLQHFYPDYIKII